MEKQVYTQEYTQEYTPADFDEAYSKIKDRLPAIIKEACNPNSFKTILRDVLANEYAVSITNYNNMLAKLTADSEPEYRNCVLAIVFPFTEIHPDQTIKKIIEDLYNPGYSYREMRIEYETVGGFASCHMGFVALQMKNFDQRRRESAALSRESKEAIIKIYKHFRRTGQMLKWHFNTKSNIYDLRDDNKPRITILSLSPTQYSEMLFFDYEADTAAGAVERYAAALRDDTAVHAVNAAHAAPGDGAYSVPSSRAEGGSRRRRRTAHIKRKSHRKSKRVHHTRRKHTRRHHHSRRRHHRR